MTRIKVEAVVLDPEDGEAAIEELRSGKVLARFPSLRSAAQTLRHWRPKYESIAYAMCAGA